MLLLAICILALPTFAGSTQVTVKLTGVGGGSQGGVYVAPYYLTETGGPTFTVMCDDYTHSVWIGESWTATIQSFASLGSTRFGAGDFQQYAEAAWLFSQFLAHPPAAGNINFAVWALFNPTPVMGNKSGWTTGAQSWYTAAQNWFAANCNSSTGSCQGINLGQFFFFTPTNLTGGYSPQEYICEVPTPEPGSISLVAVGLLFLGFLARKFAPAQSSRGAQ
jgi:hypothetical protein